MKRITTVHPVSTNAPDRVVEGAAHNANDCEESPAMSSIPEIPRRPLLLNPGDVIARNPNTGFTGSWTVATPPIGHGDDVWINHTNGTTNEPGVFVVPRDSEVAIQDGDRAKMVAAVRALADFLETHPDVPVSHVQAKYFPNHRVFEDAAARVAEVDRVGDAIGVEAGPSHEGDPHHYAKHNFGHGVTYEAVAASVYPDGDSVTPEGEAS